MWQDERIHVLRGEVMKLKYVGQCSLYGLTFGKIYDIELFAKNSLIWVRVAGREAAIPYASPMAFSSHWASVY
jgi:hypothetical protein